MRIFVFEYATGGGLTEKPMIEELAREGDMMLRALLTDLLNVPGVEVYTTRDSRLPDLEYEVNVRTVSNRAELLRAWSAEVIEADAVWPIAPETDGILEFLSAWVELAGRVLLNSRPMAVNLAASKWATARRLEEHGLPVVGTWRAQSKLPPGDGCWVLKPDQGVGCVGTRLIRGQQALVQAVAGLNCFEEWIVQPYLSGQSASLSLLVGGDRVELLGCNVQRIVIENDGFLLLGCAINGLDVDRSLYGQLVRDLVSALPGLWGYVGVDLVITDHGPIILEVNPRLTTSYVGLSRSLGENVAAMVLDLVRGASHPCETRCQPSRVDVDLEQLRVA